MHPLTRFFLGIFMLPLICLPLMFGCTQNSRAKNYGGTATIDLPKGQKLVTATWKDQQLWYLTREMRGDESPETFQLKEKSSFGMVEGTVIFKESK